MTYKRKAAVLLALAVALLVTYVLILVSEREYSRNDVFAWLDPGVIVMADRIEISGPEGGIALKRRNDVWVIDAGNMELPVKQSRVEDLFTLLSAKALYPVRSRTSEGARSLGLSEEAASRIIIRGGAGLPLLDLLVGSGDVLGREVYLKIQGRNQVHSGEGDFISFTGAGPEAWYNLRMFQALGIDAVQQADVVLPGGEAYTIRRSGAAWIIPGNENVPLETRNVEAWLRSVIEAQCDNFQIDAPGNIEGSICLRLGDGTSRTLEVSSPDGQAWRGAVVSGSSLVYTLSDWTFNRIFKESSHFIKN